MRFTHEIVDAYLHRRTPAHTRTGRHYYKTRVCANPFVSRFRSSSSSSSSIEITSRRVGSFSLFSQSRGENFAFPSLPSLDPSRPSARSFRIPECKRAYRDRIRITLLTESLIGRLKEEDRVLRVCHFTVSSLPPSLPKYLPFVCEKTKEESRAIVRPVQAPHSRVLQTNIAIVLSLHRFRRAAMKLTILHRDPSREIHREMLEDGTEANTLLGVLHQANCCHHLTLRIPAVSIEVSPREMYNYLITKAQSMLSVSH